MTRTTIVYGPQGHGKTFRADKFKVALGAAGVVDPWSPNEPITAGYLHLTNEVPDLGDLLPGVEVLNLQQAQRCIDAPDEEDFYA